VTPRFDAYVALDWSGAVRPNGIAIAECAGTGPPVLIRPGHRWSRGEALDWLRGRLAGGERVLFGIDCAYALPAGLTEGLLAESATAFDLWDAVEAACAGSPDFHGGAFADDPRIAGRFWRGGKRPAGLVEHRRLSEIACRAAGLGAPDSTAKLFGPRQVGKGGLAGMRVLRALRREMGERLAVWPFEPAGAATAVAVEIYPRLFLIRAGWGRAKLRDWDGLAAALERLGSPRAAARPGPPSDHEADALVSAAGLRHLAADPAVWAPAVPEAALRREGWIFGVPA